MAKRSAQQLRRTAAQMHALAAVRDDIGSQDTGHGRGYLREFTQHFREYESVLSAERIAGPYCGRERYSDWRLSCAAGLPAFCGRIDRNDRRVNAGWCWAWKQSWPRDQRILDAWWRREIAEDEFRRRLRFDREWGYPWEPFYELLSTARDHAEGLYALDCMPREDLRRIRSRDRHAAVKIAEIRERHPDAAIFVLFGESHLAPQHLPRTIEELLPQEKVLTILQNVDALYWRAVAQQAGAVSIGKDAVCVFNSSPLEKYESYRLCLDGWNSCYRRPSRLRAGDLQPGFFTREIIRFPAGFTAQRNPAQISH